MGIFSGISKAFKKIVKGVGNVFKKIGKGFMKLFSNKYFGYIMTAVSVFTGVGALVQGVMQNGLKATAKALFMKAKDFVTHLPSKLIDGAKAFGNSIKEGVGNFIDAGKDIFAAPEGKELAGSGIETLAGAEGAAASTTGEAFKESVLGAADTGTDALKEAALGGSGSQVGTVNLDIAGAGAESGGMLQKGADVFGNNVNKDILDIASNAADSSKGGFMGMLDKGIGYIDKNAKGIKLLSDIAGAYTDKDERLQFLKDVEANRWDQVDPDTMAQLSQVQAPVGAVGGMLRQQGADASQRVMNTDYGYQGYQPVASHNR